MTYAPPELLKWRSHMQGWTGLAPTQLGITGGPGHVLTGTSYHLGADQLKMYKTPYSARHPRDVAGLTNAASACDTGWFARLVELTAWVVAEARAGRRPDTRELIGPGGDGRAYRWAAENGWSAELRPDGDDHETHLHESFYRDSEHRDKVGLYRPFFEGDDMALRDERLTLPREKLLTGETVPATGDLENVDAATAVAFALRHAFAGRRSAEESLKVLWQLKAAAAGDETRDNAAMAAIAALTELVRAGGGDPDTAAIIEAINAKAAETQEHVEQRHQEQMADLAALHAVVVQDRDAQIAALQAELARLEAPTA